MFKEYLEYHDVYLMLPPGCLRSRAGCPVPNVNHQWGWATFLLPYIEQAALFNQLMPDGCDYPVASTLYGGAALLKQPIPVYTCPSDTGPVENPYYEGYAKLHYLVSEQMGNFDVRAVCRFRDITDGTSNSFMHAERALNPSAPVGKRYTGAPIWGRADTDSAYMFRANWPINTPHLTTDETSPRTNDLICRRHSVSSMHVGGSQFLMADGAVRFVSENIATNPALQSVTGCASSNPGNAAYMIFYGPGFAYQNLFIRDDGLPVGEY